MGAGSYQKHLAVPSAVISDGILLVPLWAVTTIGLSETYKLPPIGSSTAKAVVATHDDTLSLSGVLVGPERYAWKLALETLAESSKRGSALAAFIERRAVGAGPGHGDDHPHRHAGPDPVLHRLGGASATRSTCRSRMAHMPTPGLARQAARRGEPGRRRCWRTR